MLDYVAINAKIKAMHGYLLTYNDYDSFSKLNSVDEVANRIKDYKPYKHVMDQTENATIHRDTLERRIQLSIKDDFKRIKHFVTDQNIRKVLEAFFLKNEIFVLKILMGMVCDERTDDYNTKEMSVIAESSGSLNVKKLLTSKNLIEFVENLNGSIYYKVLSKINSDEALLFKLEMQLDLFYYMNLWDVSNRFLSHTEKNIILPIIGTDIDLHNIMWIYRFKKYYAMNPSILYSFLIPINYKLPAKEVNRLVEAKEIDTQDYLSEILVRAYKNIFRDSTTLEYDYFEKMTKVYNKAIRCSNNSLAVVISYIFSKELEINNITSLIEGIRYGLNSKDILRYLNFFDEMGVK